jgi:pilus assembly protein CpaF
VISPLPPLIRDLLDDDHVTDVLVNNGTDVWAERRGHIDFCGRLQPGDVEAMFERVLAASGRRLDRLHPMVDTRLPDGTRVCGVIPPIAVDGACAAFRSLGKRTFSIDDFSDDSAVRAAVRDLVSARRNVLVSGATGAGKTSLLAALVDDASIDDRIVMLEDTSELVVKHPHVVRLECRPATAEGRGAIDLDALLRTSLRLRPDRIVVGEIRGTEAVTLVNALNTGHRGSLATIHANSATDALARLGLLLRRATPGLDRTTVDEMISAAIHNVVHVERIEGGRRAITRVHQLHASPTP